MKLSRKQKTAANFLLAALLIAAWWFFLGAKPLTVSQAIRQEALRLGMKQRPQILCVTQGDSNYRNVVFSADGMVALSRLQASFGGISYSKTVQVKERQEITALWMLEYPNLTGQLPEFCVVTQLAEGREAQVQLHMRQQVEVTTYTQSRKYDWDETYTFTASLENGVGWFYPEEKYSGGYEQEESVNALHRAEWEVINDFNFAVDRNAQDNGVYTITVTIRDSEGNIIGTYEETL